LRCNTEGPQRGAITFEDVSLKYRKNAAMALKRLSFAIPAGCSVGIVGRTGAGKSSLVSVLFRLVDATSGSIRIDVRNPNP
jgi:ABC-type multidrug transport system fused ATPase/permease subunit